MADLANVPPVVTIIDSNSGRRDKMAEAFKGQARVQLIYDEGGGALISGPEEQELEKLEPSLVVLRHFRDLNLATDIETVLTVYFGGDGANDADAPADARDRIWRPVSSGSGYLEVPEARELLEYAIKVSEAKGSYVDKPNFLKDPHTIYMLPALLILCQGYLAAYAQREKSGWGPPIIKSALDHMGLSVFLEGKNGDLNLLQNKRGEISSPYWWLRVIKENKKSVEKQIVSELSVKSIADSPAIQALIDAIYEDARDGTEKIQPPVVARAYCAIALKMTGKPCSRG